MSGPRASSRRSCAVACASPQVARGPAATLSSRGIKRGKNRGMIQLVVDDKLGRPTRQRPSIAPGSSCRSDRSRKRHVPSGTAARPTCFEPRCARALSAAMPMLIHQALRFRAAGVERQAACGNIPARSPAPAFTITPPHLSCNGKPVRQSRSQCATAGAQQHEVSAAELLLAAAGAIFTSGATLPSSPSSEATFACRQNPTPLRSCNSRKHRTDALAELLRKGHLIRRNNRDLHAAFAQRGCGF